LTDNPIVIQTPHTVFAAPVNRCGLFANHQIDGNGRCGRYAACNMADHTKDPKCPAKGGK
jgi:hypothetical protein